MYIPGISEWIYSEKIIFAEEIFMKSFILILCAVNEV